VGGRDAIYKGEIIMPIRDTSVGWKTKRVHIPVNLMTGMLSSAGANASEGAGGAVQAAHSVTGSELTIVQAGAAGDEIYHLWAFPWDFDRSEPIRWRPIFSHASTTADTPTFKFDYMCRAEGEAILDITSHETTSISGAVSTTEDALEVWDWTATDSPSYVATGDYGMLCRLEVDDLGGASANEIELFALELEYTIKSTAGDNRRHTTTSDPVAPSSLDV